MRLHLLPIAGRTGTRLSIALRLAIGYWLAAAFVLPVRAGTPNVNPNNPRFSPVVEVVRKVKDAVVNIHSERTVTSSNDPFHSLSPLQNRINGMGTGIVIDPRGYIITNYHVVEDVSSLKIHLADGTSYPARVVMRDHEHDLAVVKIDVARPLPTIPLGTASDLMAGEPVIAIGNAFGYQHTNTTGIVSAVKRDVTLNKEMSYKSLIQTDASINPGNSGGPLLNVYGELIGVNVAIRAGAQNIGFAITVDNMIAAAAEMLSVRHRLGISHGLIVRDQIDTSVNPVVRTLVVENVETNSAAERSGVRPGDLVVQAGGVVVGCSLDLERGFLDKLPGDKVMLVVRRGNEEKSMELTLPTGDQRVLALASPLNAASEQVWRRMGMRLGIADIKLVSQINSQLRGGMIVESIQNDGPAAKSGLAKGDILVGLHQYETLSPENVLWVLNHPDYATFQPLKFFIIRNGKLTKGTFAQIGN
jgi:serine protease Do